MEARHVTSHLMHVERGGGVIRAGTKFGCFVDEHGEAFNIIRREFATKHRRTLAQGEGDIGTDDGCLMLTELLRIENGGGFLNHMTEALQEFCGRFDGGDDFLVAGGTVWPFGRKGDAQSVGRGGDFIEEGSRDVGCCIGVTVGGAMRCVQHGGTVAHRARDDMGDRHAAPAFAAIRPHGRAGACGLHAEETAGRCWYADRAATVARICQRKDACGNGSRRSARRTARGAREVPRIMCCSVSTRFGGGREAEFG